MSLFQPSRNVLSNLPDGESLRLLTFSNSSSPFPSSPHNMAKHKIREQVTNAEGLMTEFRRHSVQGSLSNWGYTRGFCLHEGEVRDR